MAPSRCVERVSFTSSVRQGTCPCGCRHSEINRASAVHLLSDTMSSSQSIEKRKAPEEEERPELVMIERQAKRGRTAGKAPSKNEASASRTAAEVPLQHADKSRSKAPTRHTQAETIHNPDHQWRDYLKLVKSNRILFVELDPRTWICQNFNVTSSLVPSPFTMFRS